MVLGADPSCKILFDNHILAMTRAMSNSDCNHPMIGPNEPLVQMNCLRGSLWSSEHWFEINCRSSHTQDIFTVICRVENSQDPSIVSVLGRFSPGNTPQWKEHWKWYGRQLKRIVSKSMARSLFWRVGGGKSVPGQLQNRDHAPLYLRYFDDTSCAVCDILDVYDISCAVCVYCATQSADIWC